MLELDLSPSRSAVSKLLDGVDLWLISVFHVLSCLFCEFDRPIWILFNCREARRLLSRCT